MREKVRVRVDVIVQDDERNIPKWIMVMHLLGLVELIHYLKLESLNY